MIITLSIVAIFLAHKIFSRKRIPDEFHRFTTESKMYIGRTEGNIFRKTVRILSYRL